MLLIMTKVRSHWNKSNKSRFLLHSFSTNLFIFPPFALGAYTKTKQTKATCQNKNKKEQPTRCKVSNRSRSPKSKLDSTFHSLLPSYYTTRDDFIRQTSLIQGPCCRAGELMEVSMSFKEWRALIHILIVSTAGMWWVITLAKSKDRKIITFFPWGNCLWRKTLSVLSGGSALEFKRKEKSFFSCWGGRDWWQWGWNH